MVVNLVAEFTDDRIDFFVSEIDRCILDISDLTPDDAPFVDDVFKYLGVFFTREPDSVIRPVFDLFIV